MAKEPSAATKPKPARSICGVCGAEIRAPFQRPAAESSPDLDMRPGEPARSTLRRWVDTCPFCEASAPDLTALSRSSRMVMSMPNYLSARGLRVALPFLRWAMLCPPEERAEAMLWAAWVADDVGETEIAKTYRKQAAGFWPEPMTLASALRLVDVLRRCGDLAGAKAQAEAIAALELDETSARIVAYQLRLIAAGDLTRHRLSSALPPPAHTPHVAQQQPAKPRGFWAWLRR